MTEMTRAILVAHNGGLFGGERSLLALAEGLQQDPGFRVLVAVPHDGPLAAACHEQGIATMVSQHRQWLARDHRPIGGAKRLLRNLMALVRTESTIRRFAPDVVYTGTGSTPFGALLARRWHVPHVWHLREFGERDYGAAYDWGQRWSGRFMAAHADRVIANSEAVRAHFEPRLARPEIEVIYNGFPFGPAPAIDPQAVYRERVADAGRPELVLIGALVEGKGQHDAIRALAELAGRGRHPRLTLAGSGDPEYTAQLQHLVQQHGLDDQVTFTGFVDDPEPLYRRAALTLICSRCEGFGRTAVESLAAGTPVIGTDAGGLPEILAPDDTGLLYPVGDPQALAHAIDTLLADPERYGRMAADGPEWMRARFGQARYIQAIGTVIRDAAQSTVNRAGTTQQQGARR